jgi:hypothetical protein
MMTKINRQIIMATTSPHKQSQRSHLSLCKVRKFFQISLPAGLSRKVGIAEGQYVEMQATREGILVKPVRVAARAPVVRLSTKEQQILKAATEKIAKINTNLATSHGLSKQEAQVAAKVGLIDPEQSWWWLESWQKKEREAEGEVQAGKVKEFESVEDLIADIRS